MLSYSQGLINNSNYGIVKTEALFGFGPKPNERTTEPLEWLFAKNFAPRSLQVSGEIENPRGFQVQVTTPKPRTTKKKNKKHKKNRNSKKINKCIVKFLNKGDKQGQGGMGGKKRRRRGNKNVMKMQRRYMLPIILGLMAAKSLLIPIALKALAFLSAKGLMMGFFSTVMASVLSLKGMFDHSHGYQHRKDDAKTQVEIIQVPSKSEDHDYHYYDEHYRRGDLTKDDLTKEVLMKGDLVRGDLVRGDFKENLGNFRDHLIHGDVKYLNREDLRGNFVKSDLYRGDLIRDPVSGDLVRLDSFKGDALRGNLVTEDVDAIRGDTNRGDLVRGDLVLVRN